MIPLRDNTKANNFPIVTVSLVLINVLVFIYQLTLPQEALNRLLHTFGVIPMIYTSNFLPTLFLTEPFWIVPLFSSMFLHGSFLHIIGNMLYLWVFGDNIEDKLGKLNFIFFYLAAGLVGTLAHIATNPTSTIPTIGASGAIAGVLGAYFIAFPKAKVLALVPVGIFVTVLTVPALLFLVLWFVFQLVSGLTAFGAGQMVAWWAHIGGFVAGVALWLILRPQKVRIS